MNNKITYFSDILIIGGGIIGATIARAIAGSTSS
jgi:L-2-hydroxyglutarate oxidase LhgO